MTTPSPRTEHWVGEALARMSLVQKAAQLTCAPLPEDGILADGPLPGMVLVDGASWRDVGTRIAVLQTSARARGPRIPVLPVARLPMGGPLPAPTTLRQGATWSPVLVQRFAEVVAAGARAAGIGLLLGPAATVAMRGPGAGSRVLSCCGGETALAEELVAAMVRGLQQPSPDSPHRPGPGAAVTHVGGVGSHDLHERNLRDRLLPPAEAAVAAGAVALCPTSSAAARVPAHTDGRLLRSIVRGEWGFTGLVLAHPGALDRLCHTHRTAPDTRTAIAQALEAGVQAGFDTPDAVREIVELVEVGAVPEALIDEAVEAVLLLKSRTGVLDDPWPASGPDPGDRAGRRIARRVLAASVVLLSNPHGGLPLDPDTVRRVLVLAADPVPAAAEDVPPPRSTLALARAIRALPARPRVAVSSAAGLVGRHDAVVAVVTGDPRAAVPQVAAAVRGGTPLVVVVRADRTDGLDELAALCPVVFCWAPAEDDGVIAEVVFGLREPRGRLPLAVHGRDGVAFPVGHGLGHAPFRYAGLRLPELLAPGADLSVGFRVDNPHPRRGHEVAQVYVRLPHRSVVARPRLAAFVPIVLEPGEARDVELVVPAARLAQCDRNLRRSVVFGAVEVVVGRSAGDAVLSGATTVGAELPGRPGATDGGTGTGGR